MILSDLSVRRPVACVVLSLLIVTVGLLSFRGLPVREFPNIDAPVVSVTTRYPGAAAEVVETQITDPLEEQLSAIDGVRLMRSDSTEERSTITLEFNLGRDVDAAANDVRDRVGRALERLPDEVDPPEVAKADADDDPVIVLSFNSTRLIGWSCRKWQTASQCSAYKRYQVYPKWSCAGGVTPCDSGSTLSVWPRKV